MTNGLVQHITVVQSTSIQWVKANCLPASSVCYSYTTVCPPVRGYNPRVLANRLSHGQADKPWNNYFIPPLSVKTLLSMKYFKILKFAISGKGVLTLVISVARKCVVKYNSHIESHLKQA